MKDENSSYMGFVGFFLVVVFLVIIGSLVLYNGKKSKQNVFVDNSEETSSSLKIKKDKNQDFIYFTEEETISEIVPLTYKKANVNISHNDVTNINKVLGQIYDEALNSVVRSDTNNHICENDSDIFESLILDYATYYYEGFITLLVKESNYSCNSSINNVPSKISSYTFEGTTGKLISSEELLEKFSLTNTLVLEKIREKLNDTQIVIDDLEYIKIEETLNELKLNETYSVYISEDKKLVVNYIVKTSTESYNDIIELN